jgi:anti-anti-sigma factor
VPVRFEQDRAGVLCRLIGNLENATLGEFREAVVQFAPKSHVIFSLEEVPFIDSDGLGALIGAIRRIREMSGDAIVCSPRPSVDRVLQIVGLPRIVDVFATVSDAKAYFLQGKRLEAGC